MQSHLDHIIWACEELGRGCGRFEALTGVRPRYGGVHAGGLTHNALVRIADSCYLEILAPTQAAGAEDDAWTRLARTCAEPRVLTYCMRSPGRLPELAALSRARGWANAQVAVNGRSTPDGGRLRWQWLAPSPGSYGLAFPFFIDWLDSPHPAQAAQLPAVHLRSFSVGHPQAQCLGSLLPELGVGVEVYAAFAVEFRVVLETPLGVVHL